MNFHPLKDTLQRPIRDLRISVTDRCNFRCSYCMPKEIFGDDYAFLPQNECLSFEEIHRLTKLFVSLGVKKIRLTGGEPLMRRNLPDLVSQILSIDGVEDVGLTTNGVLLGQQAKPLYDAGLRRLNVSLDALDPELFGRLNGRGIKPDVILKQIEYAREIGFEIKVNMVVQKGVNDSEILPMAAYFKEQGITLRFIEFMDVGNDNGWSFKKGTNQKKKSLNDLRMCTSWSRWIGITLEKWQSVIVIETATRRLALLLRFLNHFARPAHVPAYRLMASFIRACLLQADWIYVRCFVTGQMTKSCLL